MKSKPSKYFELAAPIIKAKARITPDCVDVEEG
jgi:hypothetical protein